MKKYVLACSFMVSSCMQASSHFCHEKYSRTMMFTRPISEQLSTQMALWHNFLFKQQGSVAAAVQAMYVQEGSFGSAPAARYFLFNGLNELHFAGDALVDCSQKQRDVRAEWFGLPDNFQGNMTIRPQQRQRAVSISYAQGLRRFSAHPFFDDMWLSIIAPFVWVRNDMQLQQFDIVNPSEQLPSDQFPHDIKEAFCQPSWQNAKICCEQEIFRLADLRLLIGRTYLHENLFQLAYYSILSFPTGNKPDPEFLFSPNAGHNYHFGYGAGVHFQIVLNRDPSPITSCFFLEFEGIFFARNHQWRTFDLKGKPWSRYLLFVRDDLPVGQEPTPGVNVLTRYTKVRVYGSYDFSAGFRFIKNSFEAEIGYDIWGHGQERLYLSCKCPSNSCAPKFGIAGPVTSEDDCPVTASTSTICRQGVADVDADGDPLFVPISDNDLDPFSAAAQSTFNNKFHVSLGFVREGKLWDTLFGVGFYYDMPHSNRALKVMGGWGKIGVSF